MNKRKWFFLILTLGLVVCSLPEVFHHNEGKSSAIGTVGNGKLINAWLLPYSGNNYRYFSPLSYYLLNRGYVHHRVHDVIVAAYASCEISCPGTSFRIMECANKRGGGMWPHRTHQVGLSADFMLPKVKDGRPFRWFDRLGLWHYALGTDDLGNYTDQVAIDFETMARHLLALDDAARANGLGVKKVLLKIKLKDDFFRTESGKQVRQRGVYFARALPERVDDFHDDHYHVDFELR